MGRGGSIRLIGDDQQLAAIGAGGVLCDIQASYSAVRLSELHRFADPAEAAATLALRDGRAEAIGFYLDRQRVHIGDPTTTLDTFFAPGKPTATRPRPAPASTPGDLVRSAAAAGPLPGDHPAAALWWRILDQLPSQTPARDLVTPTGGPAIRRTITTSHGQQPPRPRPAPPAFGPSR